MLRVDEEPTEMKYAFLIFAALPLCAPAADARPARSHPAWMHGTWAFLSEGQERGPEMCNNDEVERYEANGRYFDDGGPGGSGHWWIHGDRLVRVEVDLPAGASPGERGHTLSQRFVRTRTDELLF